MTLRQWMAAARAALLLLAAGLAATAPALAANLPEGFQEALVISGRNQPTAIRFAPNGHVFVAEKSGMLWLYEGLADASPTLVVDLRTQTHNFWDRGMVGVAVAPNYPSDPSVYVTYTFDAYADGTYPRWGTAGATADNCPTPPGATASGCVVYGRLSRITVNQSTLQGAESVLLTGNWCQQYPSHSINDLMFGADGYLYLSAGDGANFSGGVADYGQLGGNPCGDPPNQGGALRVQDILTQGDPTSFDGAVLRLDVGGGGVAAAPGNPLIGNAVADDDYIIAVGMRNPFRMAQRPGTGEIWLSDVGWGTWEEINVIPSAASPVENFGWPCYEGGNGVNTQQGSYSSLALCQNLYTGNIPAGIQLRASHYGYLHSAAVAGGDGCPTGGSSVTGMAFNSGNRYPAAYGNALFFADSTRRCAWTMFPDGSGVPDRTNIQVLVSQASGRIVDLQMGPDGYLYYVDFDGGRIYRIDYFAQNAPPSAAFIASPANGPAPLTVQFNGNASSDPEDGANVAFAWDLDGDGQFDDSTDPAPSWVYTQPATYTVSLRVTDSGGLSDTESLLVNAGGSPPTVTITSPAPGTTWAVGDIINFAGEARDAQGNLLPASELAWDIILHHCYTVDNCHTHPVTSFPGVDSGFFDAPDHEYPSFLNVKLTANPLPGDWFDPAWTRRVKLTLDNSGQAETLLDFQLLVKITGSRINYGDAKPDGSDLRFTDAAGNLLAHEIESWNPAGDSWAWVRVPAVAASSSSGYIYMYYGNQAAAAAENAAAVWSGYGAVWHLDGDAVDATVNGNHGAQSGTTATAGRMGSALYFNGSAYVDVLNPVGLAITGTATTEAWIKIVDPNQAGNPRIFDKKNSPWTSTTGGYTLQYKPGQNNITALGNGSDLLRAEPIDLDTDWHYLTAVYNANGTGRIYLDGVDVTTDGTMGNLVANATRFRMGQQTWGGEAWVGAIDEIRISPAARSAAWVRAQNLSMRDAMITYGTPEGEGIGSSLSASAALFLAPKTVDITVASVPAGLTLTLGSVTEPAPFTETVIQNSEQQVTAPAQQTVGPYTYAFSGWSDGGAATHLFQAPSSDLTITASYTQGAVNTAPTAAITAPADGATIPAPGAVTVSATASDAETSVQYVEFYVDGALIGTDSAEPWSTSWNATAGAHNLSAVAYDTTGLSGTSAPVGVTVQAANLPPTVAITSPANGAVIGAPGTVTITATASDPENALARVDFYVDGGLVGTDATSPYSVAWSATAGGHVLTATAVDAGSLTGNAAPVSVTVNAGGGTGGWYDSSWTRRMQLAFDNSGQAESLAGFQVLVTLTPARFNYADARADGADLRFTDAAGAILPHEVERWNPGGTSHVWVRVPSIPASSASGHVWMYYGNAAASAAESPAGVWAGYGGVWHLDGDAVDSSGNGNTGTPVATTATAGRMGDSLYFNGSAYVDVLNPVGLAITGTLTGEAWIRIDNPNQSGNPRVFDKKASPWTSAAGYTLQYKPGQNNITALGGGDNLLRAEPIDLDTQWHYLAAVYNGDGTGRVYLNGVDVTTDGSVGQLVASTTRFRMGQQTWGGEAWRGAIDEVRVSPAARSAAWIRAQNLSMRDAFIAYGAAESYGGSSNTPPTATITSPADGAVIAAPGTVTITANAADAEGPVQRVEFYDGPTLIATDTAAPWSADWSATAGPHTLTARAYDSGNASGTSPAVNVTVNGPPNQPPTASITAPADGAVIPAPGAVTISATASDPENALARVDFHVDGSLVGSDSSAPYSVSWNATAGNHSLTATAVDAGNLTGTSTPVAVSVTPANQAPSVSVTSPAEGAVIAAPGAVTISATASDPENALDRVEFYVDGGLVGTDATSPYSVSWNATAGGHALTARAVDLPGASTTSAPVNVTVNAGPPGAWWNAAWTRRLQLTLDNTGQAENLADFQLLVTLTPARVSYADIQAGGADIRFTDATGTPLPHEIERWNAGGTSHVWVRVPSVPASSAAGAIYMYYGNPAATAGDNAAAVWAGYGGVWHLDGDAADSTANGNNGTQVATTTVAGRMGSALNFNGSAYVDVLNPVGLSITGTMTGEAWIQIADPNQTGNPRVFDKKSSPWTSAAGYSLQYKPGQNNITGLGGGSDLLRAEPIDLDTQWHYLAAVYNGDGTGRIYLNGVDVTTDGTVGQLVASTTRFRMGQQTWGGEAWRGAIDEIRVSPAARSAAWIRAQNLSMRDGFIGYGAPETAP